MKIKQNCFKIGLVGLGLVLVAAFGYAQGSHWTSTSINTFINDTGQAVSGLHIEYNTTGWIGVPSQTPFTFADVQWDYNGQLNLSSGTGALSRYHTQALSQS
jgi:hypothetical protein